ncbi:MAG TPA: HEAT repeat domain-containing protein [Aggregatilineales bacterium]|nr:HEAT repeat domain-containing protein [Aggregatilineales bacterium]
MNLHELTNLLHHPDSQQRIAALRVLAMLEETRALNAIAWVFKKDSDPQVREVAKWAGSMIWIAQEHGHSTEAAIEQFFKMGRMDDIENLMMRKIMNDVEVAKDDTETRNALELSRARWESMKDDPLAGRRNDVASANKSGTQIMTNLSSQLSDDDLDLLDAGLTGISDLI